MPYIQFKGYLYFLILILLAIFIKFIYPVCKGWFGEKTVAGILSTLPQEYQIIHNVMLRQQSGRTTQIDHVVVSPYGIFVIETKNYRGYITGSEWGEKWTENKKFSIPNPIKQNYGHVKALAELLDLAEERFVPLVVFTTNADVKVQSEKIVYTTQLRKTIRAYQEPKLDTDQVNALTDKIKNANINSKKVRKEHVQAIHHDLLKQEQMIAQKICPRCGGALVERWGKHGTFMGCSSYPKCRFTAALPKTFERP